MIKGEVIKDIVRSNINYRQLDALNYSMIKLFDSDPVKFYEQFKLGKKKKDNPSTALIIGDMVDFYLLDCHGNEEEFNNRFDEKFSLLSEPKGTGQVFMLADIIFSTTQSYLDDSDTVMVSFETIFEESFNKIKALKKYGGKSLNQALEDFNDNAFDYYTAKMENIGKTVVDVSLVDKVSYIVKLLKTDSFTADVFDTDTEGIENIYKFPIEWEYNSAHGAIPCKSEIDILHINHTEKRIYLRDLKTTYDNELFENNYLKNSYYLQAAFYFLAVEKWKSTEGLGDYEVIPMEFIVADTSSNNRRPVRFKTSLHDLNMSLKGFSIRGNYNRGVMELVEDISWAEANGIWNASKTLVESDGVLKLNLNYD